jgi:hypothetical protein
LRTRLLELRARGRLGLLTTLLLGASLAELSAQPAAGLRVRRVALVGAIGESTIAGRSRCGDRTWLLNESRELIEISPTGTIASLHGLRGLSANERPWGLACLADRSLWTLAAPRTLTRIARDGSIAERVRLRAPWTALFGTGERLLFEPAPPVPGTPLLATTSPLYPEQTLAWSALVARSAANRIDVFMANLVNCGLPLGALVPCWFPEDAEVTRSDGRHTFRQGFGWLQANATKSSLPIHDVLYVARDRVWVLSGAQSDRKHRAAGRLVLATVTGTLLGEARLTPPARLIVGATDVSCLLVTIDGAIVEARYQ